jgi:hypothetical protein
LLNWIEFWFRILGPKVRGEAYNLRNALKATLEAFAEDWNIRLADPINLVL